jgi:hypothetical protein
MNFRKFLRLVISGILLSTVMPSGTQADAAEPRKLLEICEPGQMYSCIEYVGTVDSQGKAVEAITVGKPQTFPLGFAGQEFTGNSYEWKTPGIFHENGNERLQINAFYWPAGLPYCFSLTLPCDIGVDEIIVQFNGAWWGNQPKPVEFPEFGSNLQCGTKEAPLPCIRGWGINDTVDYVIRLRTPKGWALSHTVGEGRNGSTTFAQGVEGAGTLELKASPARRSVSYAIITPRIVNTMTKADATWSVLNIYPQGINSNSSRWLARCDYARGMSIWHNGNLQSYPNWDSTDQTLSLKVEAAHLQMDGTQNFGTFSIAMPLTVANCLWGADLSKATQASVSATYPELGITELVATTVKISQGTYFLSASGFHYSAPTIKVKVAQINEVAPPINEVAPPIKEAVKLKLQNIWCVKGKLIKKVTGVKPFCPKGYKKK